MKVETQRLLLLMIKEQCIPQMRKYLKVYHANVETVTSSANAKRPTDSRSYICKICYKSFKHPRSHDRHMKYSHKVNKSACYICGRLIKGRVHFIVKYVSNNLSIGCS